VFTIPERALATAITCQIGWERANIGETEEGGGESIGCAMLTQFDLYCYCHTQEGISHALQAGEQAMVVLSNIPVKSRHEGACKFNHISLNPHSSCAPFTNSHLKHCVSNYNSAGSHLYTDDTGTIEMPGIQSWKSCGHMHELIGFSHSMTLVSVESCQGET
jgi:hypothetical protein